MSNGKEIKRKIASINNTGKITKAMELISTIKMKKAQELALEKRAFVLEMLKVFSRVESYLKDFSIFKKGTGEKTLGVIITSNKGLCGGYNINVMKEINRYVESTKEDIDFVAVGKRGAGFVARTGNNLIADFTSEFTDNIDPVFTKKISRMLRDEFHSGKYAKVVVFYNHYVNTIKQVPVAKVSLPLKQEDIKSYLTKIVEDYVDVEEELAKLDKISSYELEPSPEELAEEVIPMILDMMFFDVLIEAKASEHSARMIAMKNAKDSAKKIAGALTLKYNKARQAAITKEVSEIVSGVESLKDS